MATAAAIKTAVRTARNMRPSFGSASFALNTTASSIVVHRRIQRGTHVLKALSISAKAVGVDRYYLYPLAAAGQAGVERALGLMQTEIERGMKLMGCTAINQLWRDNLRFR
jgi:isopentenyl diphosphate isomerase/L-lactate dehydrogenase-like FMN-dependent dehydrogenase